MLATAPGEKLLIGRSSAISSSFLCRKLHFSQEIQQNLLPPELHFSTPICTKSFVGWGFALDPTAGAYSVPPDPVAVFKGPTSKGKGEEGRGGVKGKVFPYSLPSVGPGADPGVQAVSPQVT